MQFEVLSRCYIFVVPAFNDFTFVRVSDVVQKYGTLWRTMHKMIHNILNMRAAATYVPYQDLENKQMLLDMMDRPAEFVNHIRRYSTSLTTQMIFGFRTPNNDDKKMQQLFTVRRMLALREA